MISFDIYTMTAEIKMRCQSVDMVSGYSVLDRNIRAT
jgi:hypothetical protein